MADKEDNRDIFDKVLEDPIIRGAIGATAGRALGRAGAKLGSKKIRNNAKYGREVVDEAKDYASRPGTSPSNRANLKRSARQSKEQFIDGPLRPYGMAGVVAGSMAGVATTPRRRK